MHATRALERWSGLEDLRPALKRFLAQRRLDEHDSEDVIQETLLRAARYRRGQTCPERLSGWVIRIAINVLHDRKREAARWRNMALDQEGEDSLPSREPIPGEGAAHDAWVIEGECIEGERLLGLLAQAYHGMRGADRRVLQAYYGGEQSCSSAARDCAISPALLKVRLFRARRRLEAHVRKVIVAWRLQRLVIQS